MRVCPKCLCSYDFSKFYVNKRTPDGLSYICKDCQSKYSKEYKAKNKDKVANNKKQWYGQNKVKVSAYSKKWYKENRRRIIQRVVQYRSQRLKQDIQFKLQKNIRHRLGKLLKQSSSSIAISFLGCSLEELKVYLESKFQPGMTWDNWSVNGWHIDHIKPLNSFDLSSSEELKRACHYTNLQPLWAKDNLLKSDKVE